MPAPAAAACLVFAPPRGKKPGVFSRWCDGDKAPTKTTIPDVGHGGSMGVGSTGPVLSPDARWLAYTDDEGLALWDFTTKTAHHEHAPGAYVLIGGFSLDSTSLLFHYEQQAAMDEEPPPLPAGIEPGFHSIGLADRVVTRHAKLPAFDAWSPVPGRVLHIVYDYDHKHTRLVEHVLATGEERDLQQVEGTSGFSQRDVHGDRLVSMASTGTTASWVATSRLDGSEALELSRHGGWADIQWPRWSRDGTRVVYSDRASVSSPVKIMVVEPGKEAVVVKCPDCSDPHWLTDDVLVVRSGGSLVRLALDGGTETIAPEMTTFVLAGQLG